MADDTKAAATGARPPQTKPFSLQLTDDEKRLLLGRAGKMPLGTYVRGLILEEDSRSRRRRVRRTHAPIKDHESLARMLAALGQSRIANNLNQIAKAAHMGVLPLTPETESVIGEACTAVVAMRLALMQALDIREGGAP
jgi:hypothetical protein